MSTRILLIIVLSLLPTSALAQDLFEEIPKLQDRMEGLDVQIHASQGRLLASATLNARQNDTFVLLSGTRNGLLMINREFQALYKYKFLASLITEQLATKYAMRTVVLQRDYLKKISKGQIEWVEKSLHTAADQETTRLLLEARDLFRSSLELLDRLQVPEPAAK